MRIVSLLLTALPAIPLARASEVSYVHPIEVDGKQFVDSVTSERFVIRGIDYQPGGAASYTKDSDPLSDPDVCARDVFLFQELGINTVRVYTINPHLNHDACMTMLAAANIYLLLDVNSPLVGESINRYEPWTTYTPDYLRHVFEVVDQFSRYNNTLGYFIGNEVVNDERSAGVSPAYIRAVARDVKDYMYYNCGRSVPIGYSAADDLRYRKQLSHYLTCGARETAVDFYGVNSYQWCGRQSMRSSGYDVLIKDHADFQVPVFFSEFGCNLVQPRLFQEVSAIYSPAMTDTFSGGLVYEFSQEENDYGLVEIDKSGDAYLREDFGTLQKQFADAVGPQSNSDSASPLYTNATTAKERGRPSARLSRSGVADEQLQSCLPSYPNLSGARHDVPESFGTDMIRNGVRVQRGKYLLSVLEDIPESPFDITLQDGTKLSGARMKVVNNFSAHADEVLGSIRGNGFAADIGDAVEDKDAASGRRKKDKIQKDTKKSHARSVHGQGTTITTAVFIFIALSIFVN